MEVRGRGHALTVLTFPHDDAVFAERVTEALEEQAADASSDDIAREIERRLRVVHPRVATSFRDRLAGFGDLVMYVFRDGTARSSFESDAWIADPATARVVTDENGTYVDANDAAEELFGVSRDRILRARAGSFTTPDARIADEKALWGRLEREGKLHSLAVLTRGDGTVVSVEFITVRDADGPGRHVTHLREVD
jgi:PAS domain S-box-containing protein